MIELPFMFHCMLCGFYKIDVEENNRVFIDRRKIIQTK